MSDSPRSEPVKTDHAYDGIEEFDNPLPGWWKWLFIGTILFSPFYWIFYHGGTEGRSIQDQYDRALAENTRRQFGGMDDVRPDRDSLARLVTDEDRLKVGRIVFRTHCIACHGKNGEGKIGVNLTDDVYKNVRNIEDIVTVIANGAGGNAMPSWSAKLHEKEIVLVSAYVASLRDTNVEGGRIAEGRQIDPWPEPPPEEEAEPSQDTEQE